MQTYIFEGIITALTSISHIGETHGINARLRREKVVQPDGTVEEVPVISGNSLRGILRDRGMLHMLRSLGYGVDENTGEVSGLSLAAFHFLFSGGALSSTGARGLDIDEARKWRDLIPLVSLFGGAMGNQIMPGKAKIGKAIPICLETAHLIPERYVEGRHLESIWEMIQEESYTRRDDEKNDSLRVLIAPEVRKMLEAEATVRREKARSGKNIVTETGQKQQMRYYIETLAAGTQFFWEMTLEDVSPLEFEALCVALAELARVPNIGGRSGVGHGKVAIHFDQWIAINPRLAPTGTEISFALGNLYKEHLEQHREEIRSLIDGMW